MPQTTEADGLLRTGALYTRRVGLRRPDGGLLFAGVKRGAFSLYFDDAPIYHFDLEGRWQRAFVNGVHFRKGLDNSVDAIDRVREGASLVLNRRALGFAEIADLDASIRDVALTWLDRLGPAQDEAIEPPAGVARLGDADLRDLLERVAGWDANAWFAHRERYLSAYAPLGFLPPDAHQAIVLQATVGDARSPAFGGRAAHDHAARTPSEFLAHAREVKRLLGLRVLQANGVFCGGGDVLARPFADVEGYWHAMAEVFPLSLASGPASRRDRPEEAPSLGGIDVFLDVFGPHRPDRDGWVALKARGLRRVNLGVESGDPEVRRLHGSKATDDQIVEAVIGARAAGLRLGIVVLADGGGRGRAETHLAATSALLHALPLGRGDLVYFVDSSEIAGDRVPRGIEAMAPSEREAWTARMKSSLEAVRARGAKVAAYRLEKTWN